MSGIDDPLVLVTHNVQWTYDPDYFLWSGLGVTEWVGNKLKWPCRATVIAQLNTIVAGVLAELSNNYIPPNQHFLLVPAYRDKAAYVSLDLLLPSTTELILGHHGL